MAKTEVSIYSGNDIEYHVAGYVPEPEKISPEEATTDRSFKGYPQVIRKDIEEPKYEYKVEKDIMVTMRDGVKIAIDIYHPDTEGEKFPTIICWGEWGKDSQDIVAWLRAPQKYFDSPFWNGSIEGCDFTYTVPRGYVHIIAEPRGIGNSEGENTGDGSLHSRKDIYDLTEWVAKQEWSTGKVVMMGPSSYSRAQLQAGQEPRDGLRPRL